MRYIVEFRPDENDIKYKEFCEKRNLKIEYKNMAYGDGSESGNIIDNQDETYKYSYITHSQGFPKSKELNIEFDKIKILKKQNKEGGIKEIKGNWNFKINLPKEFYNRETVIYNIKTSNIQELKLTRATVSKTDMKISFETRWGESVYNEKDDEETKREKTKIWLESQTIDEITQVLIKNEYIENSKGERFYSAQSNDEDGGYGKMADGTFLYHQTFNITSFECTEELTVVLPLEGELLKKYKEPIIIKLSRNK